MWRPAAWAVVGTLLLAAASAAIAQEPAAACVPRAADLTELIACLKTAYGRTDAAQPRECARRPPTLAPPVEGRRVLSFGERTTFDSPSKGTVTESAPGAPVSAPAAGFVLFAGAWRSYGPLLILDAGCGAEVLLAGAALTVAAGDQVARGGRIGRVVEPAPDGPPVVYLELRRDGVPVDPEQ